MLNFTLHASIGEMKKIVSIWTIFFTYSFLGFAQNPITYANDYATMPVAVVKVNFHFLQLRQCLYFILFKVGNQTVYQTKLSIQK
jgi:hypothetical protein